MRIVTIPCLTDNFAYLVIDGATAAVVDPSEAAPVEAACQREAVTLAAIWLTHHHWDHVGGVPELVAAHPGIAVVASVIDAAKIRNATVTQRLEQGATVSVGQVTATIIHNPGHTLGAISFHLAATRQEPGAVFSGDTLFGAGCGRIFEGDPETMYASVMKLAALPPQTKLYFGHEYTAANLAFAAAVEPDNAAVARRAAELTTPSTPSTIAAELATNPFLRAGNPIEFGRRRSWKDRYR